MSAALEDLIAWADQHPTDDELTALYVAFGPLWTPVPALCCVAATRDHGHTFECDSAAYAAGTRDLRDCRGTL